MTLFLIVLEIVIIVIFLSDFKLLKFGFAESIYFWLEYPDINLTRIQTIDEIFTIINYNYNVVMYKEGTNNSEIKVIITMENLLLLDTRYIFENIKNGLKFTLFFNDKLEITGDDIIHVPTQDIAVVEIIHTGEISKGMIIQEFKLTSINKTRLENVKKGQFEGISAFLKIKLNEDFENASSEDLKCMCELITNVKMGAI